MNQNKSKFKTGSKEWMREWWIYKKYNLLYEDYENMLLTQNNKCAICNITFNTLKNSNPSIDHCHKTQKVRSILCSGCNSGIGLLKENIITLNNAIEYLQKYNMK